MAFIKKTNMAKILALGNALVDILIKLDSENILQKFNLPKGSMQLVDLELSNKINESTTKYNRTIFSGGSAANTINGLANLGVKTGFIGKIGNDEFGEYFKTGLSDNDITANLLQSNTPTGRAITLISDDGERTFATYLGAAVEQVAKELKSTDFFGYNYFHVEGYLVQNHQLLEKAFQLAKQNNLKTSIDLASYNVVEENLDFLKDIVNKYVDIVFANEEEAKAFTGKNSFKAALEISKTCEIAVVKLGKKGSLIRKKNNIIKIDSIEANCIDTTGAGDLFASGFLYGLANNFSLRKCGQIGSMLAGKVIENIGAVITSSQWDLIKKQLNNL